MNTFIIGIDNDNKVIAAMLAFPKDQESKDDIADMVYEGLTVKKIKAERVRIGMIWEQQG
jgi:hypothetical protein